jgi:hypothetical protein
MTLITGTENSQQLNSYCCDSTKVNSIKVDSQCFKAFIDGSCGNNSLCLQYLDIPIDSAFSYVKKIPANSSFVIDDSVLGYRFLAVYIKDNKKCFWRPLDTLSDNYETINYSFEFSIVSEDVTTGNKVPITMEVTLTPDNDLVLLTWANASTTDFDDHTWTNWSHASLTWFGASAANLSNSLILLENTDGTHLIGTLTGDLTSTDNKVKFHIEFKVDYNVVTETATTEIIKITLNSEFIDTAINIFETDSEITVEDGIITATVEGITRTHLVKRWKSLDTILVLCSQKTMLLGEIEIFNNNSAPIDICILGAY